MTFQGGQSGDDFVHINVASRAGGYTVGSVSFFRYIVRLTELGLPLTHADREALDVLAAIPHAFDPDDDVHTSGRGWRVVPSQGDLDWPVLEATPERLRSAFERAHSILWAHAARASVSAREIAAIEEELEAVYGVIRRAEAAGVSINISYVA